MKNDDEKDLGGDERPQGAQEPSLVASDAARARRAAIWAKIQRQSQEYERIAEAEGFYHRGYRFWPPFACFTCGEPISARQFAFARVCGPCDVGSTKTARLLAIGEIFIAGKAVLENANDNALIRPEFIPSHRRQEFPVRNYPKTWDPSPIKTRQRLQTPRAGTVQELSTDAVSPSVAHSAPKESDE